jgi:hypothetical protein
MNNWITIISFTYPHEAHIANGKLQSEGIETRLLDEFTTQVNNFYSNAIGGVKIQVKEGDVEKALQILKDGGFLEESAENEFTFIRKLNKVTSQIPLISNLLPILRFFVLFVLLFAAAVIIFHYATRPSKLEQLTETSWCVDEMFLNDVEIFPYTVSDAMAIIWANCEEEIIFHRNLTLTLPGLNTYSVHGYFELNHKRLLISECSMNTEFNSDSIENIQAINNELNEIYAGSYKLSVNKYTLKMESDNLLIIAKPLKSILF